MKSIFDSEERTKRTNKAVLVFDEMYEKCGDCPCCDKAAEVCRKTGKHLMYSAIWKKKHSWCPLKEIPERKTSPDDLYTIPGQLGYQFAQGYNKCLDDILEEKER